MLSSLECSGLRLSFAGSQHRLRMKKCARHGSSFVENQLDLPSTSELSRSAGTSHLLLRYMIVSSLSSFRASARRANLSVQRVQHFSSSGKIDDFVLGVECVDDGVQARLTLLGTPLTCEN